jgi:4-hydroxybenzoate polyprenyltransferase
MVIARMSAPHAPDDFAANAPLTPDALKHHWSLLLLPGWARPYGRLMRLERPVGWQLLLWPCVFASLLASLALEIPVQWAHLALFVLGSIIMRGAGCTLNDIIDRDIDAKVARSALRPIPSGEVSARNAAFFLVGLLAAGFLILIQFNLFTIGVGIASLVLVALYPFAKRVTNWPQLVLGLVFSWGALVGWTAQTGSFDTPMALLYVACFVWIVGYDTIYAFQDLEDDALVGVGSSAQALGAKAPVFVGFCYALTLALIALAYTLVGAGLAAYAGLALAAVVMGWQVVTVDLADEAGCLKRFKSNALVGAADLSRAVARPCSLAFGAALGKARATTGKRFGTAWLGGLHKHRAEHGAHHAVLARALVEQQRHRQAARPAAPDGDGLFQRQILCQRHAIGALAVAQHKTHLRSIRPSHHASVCSFITSSAATPS